jgi:hypothetical protein
MKGMPAPCPGPANEFSGQTWPRQLRIHISLVAPKTENSVSTRQFAKLKESYLTLTV